MTTSTEADTSASNQVVATEGFAAITAAKLSPLGFFMALPPVLVVLCFVGIPIFIAFSFSLGFTGGPNEVISINIQDVNNGKIDFKLEKEEIDDDHGNNMYDDSYHDDIGKKIDNLTILLEDKEHVINNELFKYYNDLLTKRTEYKTIFKNLNNNYIEQSLLFDQITNEINLLNIKVSEYKDEIRQKHENTLSIKSHNPTIKEILKNPITEKIGNILHNVDLSKIPKFSKQLSEANDKYVADATNVLRVNLINTGKRRKISKRSNSGNLLSSLIKEEIYGHYNSSRT